MQRSLVETVTGTVRVAVNVQQERDGSWVACVPALSPNIKTAPTKTGAIKAACDAVSVPA